MDSKKEISAPDSEVMDQNTALNVLVDAIRVGQSRGAWRLEETEILLKAIRTFTKK